MPEQQLTLPLDITDYHPSVYVAEGFSEEAVPFFPILTCGVCDGLDDLCSLPSGACVCLDCMHYTGAPAEARFYWASMQLCYHIGGGLTGGRFYPGTSMTHFFDEKADNSTKTLTWLDMMKTSNDEGDFLTPRERQVLQCAIHTARNFYWGLEQFRSAPFAVGALRLANKPLQMMSEAFNEICNEKFALIRFHDEEY